MGGTERPRRLSQRSTTDAPPSRGGSTFKPNACRVYSLRDLRTGQCLRPRFRGLNSSHRPHSKKLRTPAHDNKHKNKDKLNSPSLESQSEYCRSCVLCPSMLLLRNFLCRHRPPPPKVPSPSRQPSLYCLPVTPPPAHPDFLCVRRRGSTGHRWHCIFRPPP